MLSPDELHAFVRDERAWRRAAQKALDDGAVAPRTNACSRDGNWPVFRRGTSDNAFSLKFANGLRVSTLSDSVNTAASSRSTVPRPRWNSGSGGGSENASADPLQVLLARNLQKRGVTAALAQRRSSQLSLPSCISPAARAAQRRSAAAHAAEALTRHEQIERRRLTAAAQTRFNTMMTTFFDAALRDARDGEWAGRRAVFREWREWHGELAATMERELAARTGMASREFNAMCHLLRSETHARRRIGAVEGQDRELLARFMYLELLKATEKELHDRRRRSLQSACGAA